MFRRLATIAAALAASTGLAAAQDAAAGQKVFAKCAVCHEVGPNAKAKVGPPLTGVVGRQAASVPGYAYSATFKKKAEEIGVWDEAKIDQWISNPAKYAGGSVKMMFMLPSADERKNVIAYLATQK